MVFFSTPHPGVEFRPGDGCGYQENKKKKKKGMKRRLDFRRSKAQLGLEVLSKGQGLKAILSRPRKGKAGRGPKRKSLDDDRPWPPGLAAKVLHVRAGFFYYFPWAKILGRLGAPSSPTLMA